MLQGELASVGDEDGGFLWRPDLHVGAASHEHLPVPHLLRLAMPERHAPTKTLGERPTMHLGPIPYRHAGNSSSSSSMLSCSTSSKWLAHSRAIPSSPSLSDDLLKMFKDPALADVEIVCVGGEEQVFKVHRVILAARSPVFRAMFLTGMREERARQVKVEDASAEAVKCMLYFAYTDGYPDLDQSNVFDVLKLANKYDIPGLTDHCVDWMSYNAHSENVVDILAACDCYSLHDFKHLLLAALLDKPAVLHECLHAQGLDSHPDLMKELLSLAAHKLSPASKERRVVKYFDGLPYRSRCSVCVREVASMSKQMLGEMLFPMVARLRPEFANKITGMILELDNMELVPLLESDHALREKVEEAMAVLRAVEETPSSLASSNSRGGDNARRGQQQRAARSGSGGGVIGEEVVGGGAVGGSGGAALSGSGAPYSEVAQDQESSESSGMEVFQDDTFLGL